MDAILDGDGLLEPAASHAPWVVVDLDELRSSSGCCFIRGCCLPTARARALSKQRHPSFQASAEPARATAVALDPATATAASYAGIPIFEAARSGQRAGMPHLSDRAFIAWLAQERQQFEDNLDRRVEEYRLGRDLLLRG